jgi:hypothetical protein
MVMPTLWTRGYDSNIIVEGSSSNDAASQAWTGLRRRRQAIRLCQTNAPAFALAVVATETIGTLLRWVAARIVVSSSPSLSLSLSWTLSSAHAVLWRTVLTAAVAAAAAPHIRSSYLESWSRRLLWSQRRLWGASVAALGGVWVLAARLV